MRCRQAKKLVFDYIDGAISESDRIGLERHLGECRACEAMASALSRSLDLLHRLPVGAPSENFNWKLRLRLAREKNAWRRNADFERKWERAWGARFAVGAGSAFAVVLFAGFILLKAVVGPGDGVTRFEWGPEATVKGSPVATDRGAADRSVGSDPFVVPRFSGRGSQPVAMGIPSGGEVGGDYRGAWGPILDVDSLKTQYVGSLREYQRIRRLEQQVEMLHDELEKCDLERRESPSE